MVGLTTCLIPALYLPAGIPQAQLATPAETSTGELPAAGHLAPTPTVAQSTTAMKPTLQPPTPVNALAHLQSQVITNVDDFLSTLKPRTPVNVELLESYLEGHPDSHFVSSLCSGLREGFRIGYSGPRTHSSYPNLRSANLHPDILEHNLLTEVLNGHTAGPFPFPPFKHFRISPLGLVPKKHSSKWRTIFHLSYPKTSPTSINANIPIEDYTLQYITIDNAIHLLLSLGKGAFMSKTDIQSAFRIIPIHPHDWELLGMQWKGLYFFDTVLPFGLRSAPFLFNMLSDALEWIIRHKLNITGVMHILDDFFIALPPPRSHCSTALCHLLTLFTDLDIPLAPGKTFTPSTQLEFMGILLDSSLMEAKLPDDKLTRLRSLVSVWQSKTSCRLHDLQSLIGSLHFACKVVAPGRPFLRRMISLTRGLSNPSSFIRLGKEFHKDLDMWAHFLASWNGINLFLPPFSPCYDFVSLVTDASGSVGYGAFLHPHWFNGKWLPHQKLGSSPDISIAWQELFPIYLACAVWGPFWCNRHVRFSCDNQAVVSIINTKSSKIPRIMDLLRPITLFTLQHNFTLTAVHLAGLQNGVADSLSRFQMERFRELAPEASPIGYPIPEYLTHI